MKTEIAGKPVINRAGLAGRLRAYRRKPLSFLCLAAVTLAMAVTVAVLVFIVAYILFKGVPYLTPELFSWNYNSTNVSALPSIITTLCMVAMALAVAGPLGIFCAVYLVEYAKPGSRLVKMIRLTAETLSGIPSIIYGLFGFIFFVTTLGWGYSLLAGGFTLAIMILPLVIRTTEEALKSISDSLREASFGLGAGRLRTVFRIVLPGAVPGILSGVILAIGRIVGETAALIYTAGTVAKIPENLMASGRTLAVHMYALSSEGLHTDQAYATAVVLLVTVLLINFLAGWAARTFTTNK